MKPIPRISVHNLQRKIRVDVVDLEQFAGRALALCLDLLNTKRTHLEMLSEVSVLIVSDRRMASLHHRFMSATGPTDVITFQHGEIFVSAEMAAHNARRFGTSRGHELRLYIVHGLLHLHGFDDRTQAGARKIRTTQEKILAKAAV
jgi:probable rRNA maturation factor